MKKTFSELMAEIVRKINTNGCRVTIPYSEPSPFRASFDGSFSNAEYIQLYPATLHIYGMPGVVSVSDLQDIEVIDPDHYLVRFGRDERTMDILIGISV